MAVAASLGFLVGMSSANINFAWVGALLLGGMIAAPIAAWLVRMVPPGCSAPPSAGSSS